MRATVRTSARVLVHETLAVFASHLRTLLGRHWHLRGLLRSISLHWRAIARIHRHRVARIGIVSRSGPITTVTLLDWVSARLRHIARHLLRHATCWDESDLCLAAHMRTALALHHSFETILDSGSTSRSSTGWNADAEREGLGLSLAEIAWACDLDVSREESVLHTMHFLNALIVYCYPDGLLETLEDPSFKFDTVRLNVLLHVHVNFTDNCFSLLEGSLVKGDPDFALRGYEMIE